MMRGKYSPTISMAYAFSQEWHKKFAGDNDYDPEGYDSYGYNKDNFDRADIHEDAYMMAPLEEYLEDCPRNDPRLSEDTFEILCQIARPFEVALVERLRKLNILVSSEKNDGKN